MQAAFLAAFNQALEERDEIIAAYQDVMDALTDTADLDAERGQLQNEMEVTVELIRKTIDDTARHALDQQEYQQRYNDLCQRYEKAQARLGEVENQRLERTAKRVKIMLFMEQLNARDTLVETFDEELWYSTVDFVTVLENKELIFTFRDGRKVQISNTKWRAA